MKVIKCDKCNKEITIGVELVQYTEINEMKFIDLCKDCSAKFEEMREEFHEYEKSLSEVFKDLLKNKADKLNEKYFGKKEKEIKE